MAATVLVDTGFLAALFRRGDAHRAWAIRQAGVSQRPWHCCEAVLTEALFLLGKPRLPVLSALLQRRALQVSFSFADQQDSVAKYADVPMSLADACVVRMTELFPASVLLTTDAISVSTAAMAAKPLHACGHLNQIGLPQA